MPLLAHKVERFHTFAAREMNICFKLSFFQVLNTALPSTICTWVDDYNPLGTWSLGAPWYATGGTVILTALVGDFIFINFLIDFVRPDVRLIRRQLPPAVYPPPPLSTPPPPLSTPSPVTPPPQVLFMRRFLAPRARTQRQMNALYKRDADIYVAFRLQVYTYATLTMATLTMATLTMATLTVATLTVAMLTMAVLTMTTPTVAMLTMAMLIMAMLTMAMLTMATLTVAIHVTSFRGCSSSTRWWWSL